MFAGGVVRHVATRFEDDFALDPAAVEAAITPRTKALFLGYPCNPTGAVLADARRRTSWPRSPCATTSSSTADEIYDRLAYGTYRHRAMSALPGHARADDPDGRLLEGLRDDRLAGRLGVPRRRAILEGIVKVHQYGIMSAPTTAQDAALVALVEGEPEVERMRRRVRPAPAPASSTG